MYGTQTNLDNIYLVPVFENDVKMYGTQTGSDFSQQEPMFENDVKMYGTQTEEKYGGTGNSLRMM